jgi:hypothetical protein
MAAGDSDSFNHTVEVPDITLKDRLASPLSRDPAYQRGPCVDAWVAAGWLVHT